MIYVLMAFIYLVPFFVYMAVALYVLPQLPTELMYIAGAIGCLVVYLTMHVYTIWYRRWRMNRLIYRRFGLYLPTK